MNCTRFGFLHVGASPLGRSISTSETFLIRPWCRLFKSGAQLLGKSDIELAIWRDALVESVGPKGTL